MERFEARYDTKMLASVSTSIKIFFGAAIALFAGVFLYYALALSESYRLILAAIFAVILVADFFVYKIASAKIRRFQMHARSGLPAITFDRRGVWVHERSGDSPISWEVIEEIEDLGTGKNRALSIRTRPGTQAAEKPVTIPAGFYDADIDDIAAALSQLRKHYR